MRRRVGWLLAALLLPAMGHAQSGLDPQWEVSGTLKTSYWSGDRSLDDQRHIGQAALWGKLRLHAQPAGQLVGEGWVQSDTRHAQRTALLRELYWRADVAAWQFRVGKQLIAWGRADGLNPTDNLAPKDFTQLAPQDDDLRVGVNAVVGRYSLEQSSLSLTWLPNAASHRIPLQTQAGVVYVREPAPDQSQYAFKWERLGTAADWSLSWFDGHDLMPDLLMGELTAQGLNIIERNQRVRILGGDLSVAQGNRVWRAELAYRRTDSDGRGDFSHKKHQLWMVGGPEFALDNNWTVGVQVSLARVADFARPEDYLSSPIAVQVAWRQLATANQTRRNQTGVTWRIAKSAFNDTVQLETSGVLMAHHQGGLIRAHVDFMPRDALHLRLGAEHYHGPPQTFFGQLVANQLAYLQASYGF